MENAMMWTSRLVTLTAFALCGLACSSPQGPAGKLTAAAQPAMIEGIWHMAADTPSGSHEAMMFVEQDGEKINGRFEGALGVMHYAGTVTANEIRFGHLAMAGSMRFDYTGTVTAGRMDGTAVFGTLGNGTWTATRMPDQ